MSEALSSLLAVAAAVFGPLPKLVSVAFLRRLLLRPERTRRIAALQAGRHLLTFMCHIRGYNVEYVLYLSAAAVFVLAPAKRYAPAIAFLNLWSRPVLCLPSLIRLAPDLGRSSALTQLSHLSSPSSVRSPSFPFPLPSASSAASG